MEGKLHQANENRKRRMMNQNGPHHTQKYRNSSGGFTPRHNKPPAQNYRPNYSNNNGGPPKPGGNHNNHSKNNNSNPNNTNNHPNGNNNNPNNAPRTGSNTVPINPKDKSTVNCYECGVVGHYSNECPKKLARIAANTAPAQQQRRFAGQHTHSPYFPGPSPAPGTTIPSTILTKTWPCRGAHGTSMPFPSPLPSKPINHVSELAWTLLMLTLPALDQDDVDIGRATRAQTRPENAHARHSAHGDVPGRARASPCPVASRLPSLSPGTSRLAAVPSTSQTTPLRRASPVDDDTDDDHPPQYTGPR
ncbi:hypothetical protein QYE76_048366 [Lolium multiflorum]|uniref:CCHC-type domain-containing protein n=1 Tax=Lolium multiflorum TaxID=4521 RepID=A0AAD8SKX3_LOLMU|nr:hypothetical protein QYE76_048366 [Lolium multiflorum]